MGQSSHLRLSEINAVHRIVNECRELWADALGWRQHLVERASRLTGMAVVHYSEYLTCGPHGKPVAYCNADVGWRDANARAVYLTAVETHPDAFKYFPGSERFLPRLESGRAIVVRRSDMCPDHEWYRSYVFNEFRRFAHNDDFAVSIIPHGRGEFAVLDVNQDAADPRPTRRTKRLLAFLHRRIDPLVGTELTSSCQRGVHGLTPQLRATLEQLLKGKTEKAIAAELGIRPPTVHEYVGKLYRHFCVRSRAELMAYFIRRRPS